MPARDGTGPVGRGPAGDGRRGGMGAGMGGYCVCPQCGEKMPHQAGVPCSSVSCPKCGFKMVRDA